MADHQSFTLGIKLLAPVVLAKKGPANFGFTAIRVEIAVSGRAHQQAGGFINEAESAATLLRAIEERSEFRVQIAILRGCCSQTLGSHASEYSSAKSPGLIGRAMICCPTSVGCKMAGSDMGLSELQVNQRLVG